MPINFADKLSEAIAGSKSVLCAGLDPQPETMPKFLLDAAAARSKSDDDFFYTVLRSFYDIVIEALTGSVAITKPNIAFFEQFGLSGIRAFSEIVVQLKAAKLLVIVDGKRGDIGSTADAYAKAFLGNAEILGRKCSGFEVDALTVNPYLGFDTLEPFLARCEANGKGIFVLVKTSNPGSKDLQDRKGADGVSISEVVADALAKAGELSIGTSGFSSVGAVVGATHPDEARALRARMPKNYFLIPGYGAQGGSAADAVAGFSVAAGGIVNVSRALLSGFGADIVHRNSLIDEIKKRALKLNADLLAALGKAAST